MNQQNVKHKDSENNVQNHKPNNKSCTDTYQMILLSSVQPVFGKLSLQLFYQWENKILNLTRALSTDSF